jgi:phage FluMu protein Com
MREWRCRHCHILLGVWNEGKMMIRFARGHQYSASSPVAARCRRCGELNEFAAAPAAPAASRGTNR